MQSLEAVMRQRDAFFARERRYLVAMNDLDSADHSDER
jgi:hypothetical protein